MYADVQIAELYWLADGSAGYSPGPGKGGVWML